MILLNHISFLSSDTSGQYHGMLSFERKELKRYSIWDQQELDLCGLRFEDDEDPTSGILLFYVSQTAAAAIQQDLCHLCVKGEGSINSGENTGDSTADLLIYFKTIFV